MTRGRQRRRERQQATERTERIAGVGERPTWEVRLEQMAVSHGWIEAITPPVLQGIFRRQAAIAINPDSEPGDATRAASVVVRIVDQVQKQEAMDAGVTKEQPGITVNVQVNGLTANQRDREIASLLDAARARAITCTAQDSNGDGVDAATRDDAGQVADAGT